MSAQGPQTNYLQQLGDWIFARKGPTAADQYKKELETLTARMEAQRRSTPSTPPPAPTITPSQVFDDSLRNRWNAIPVASAEANTISNGRHRATILANAARKHGDDLDTDTIGKRADIGLEVARRNGTQQVGTYKGTMDVYTDSQGKIIGMYDNSHRNRTQTNVGAVDKLADIKYRHTEPLIRLAYDAAQDNQQATKDIMMASLDNDRYKTDRYVDALKHAMQPRFLDYAESLGGLVTSILSLYA